MSKPDEEELARLFRENDNLGDDSHVLLRPLRTLLAEGKSPGRVLPLLFKHKSRPTNPFGALYTGKDRVSFWPVYPKGTDMTNQPDHITLELPSGKSHWTGYDADGTRLRQKGQGTLWRLHRFPETRFAWWFQMLVRWDTILQQGTRIQRKVGGKSEAANQHAIKQFSEYVKGLTTNVTVPLPPSQRAAPEYLLLNVYVAIDPSQPASFRADMFDSVHAAGKIRGWPDADTPFPMQAVTANCNGHQLCFAVGCPPGSLDAAVWCGLPKKK